MADKQRRRAAARARAEAERRRRARRKQRTMIAGGAALIVLLVIVLVIALSGSGSQALQYLSGPGVDPSGLPGILTNAAPWPTDTAQLSGRLSSRSLPPLNPTEGQAVHIHQHIDIYIEGRAVTVPAGIGIATTPSTLFAPIHTHNALGIIHVESPVDRDYSLGDFFDVWGVRFTSTCIGGYCNTVDERLQVFANGKVVTRDPRLLKLTQHEEIVVTFGTPAQIPRPYPVRYNFPPNE